MKKLLAVILIGVLVLAAYLVTKEIQPQKKVAEAPENTGLGSNIVERYNPPEGFERKAYPKSSFASFMRQQRLLPAEAKVKTYNGKVKPKGAVYDAVFEVNLNNKDLLQCADSCMRFTANYLHQNGKDDQILFKLASGETAKYTTYASMSGGVDENTYERYMEYVYNYAGTMSLPEDTFQVGLGQMKIGDIFLNRKGDSGHAVSVIDMAEDKQGHKAYMLAQSYMPAQNPQVLLAENGDTVWYRLDDLEKSGQLRTPEWTFSKDDLRRFKILEKYQ